MGNVPIQALKGVSLCVQRGEFVAILGASGSGKSTFMNLVGCLDRPTSGSYLFLDQTVQSLSSDRLAALRNKHIGFVFQHFHLLPRLTALENVALPLLYAGYPRAQRNEMARQVLQLVGLSERIQHIPAQLSGGQQQRVAIARALVNTPDLILADEPTGNLDSYTRSEIMALLQSLHQRGLTIMLVTHDPEVAVYAPHRIYFRDGFIVEEQLFAQQYAAEDTIHVASEHSERT
ncbi:ABC transporter ATP-binding protein [Ktedonobacteria bacterium brp13]|nr:ABC transporter ATP-binding protein [Ktedonobacteria bacterium brp13]